MATIDDISEAEVRRAVYRLNYRLELFADRRESDVRPIDDEGVEAMLSEMAVVADLESYAVSADQMAEQLLPEEMTTDELGQLYSLVGLNLRLAGNLCLAALGESAWVIDAAPVERLGTAAVRFPESLLGDGFPPAGVWTGDAPTNWVSPPNRVLEWTTTDELFGIVDDIVRPLPMGEPGALSAAAGIPQDGAAYVTATEAEVGSQLITFLAGSALEVAVALPIDKVVPLIDAFLSDPDLFTAHGVLRRLVGRLVRQACRWLEDLMRRLQRVLGEMVEAMSRAAARLGQNAAGVLLGTKAVRARLRGSADPKDLAELWKHYAKCSQRLSTSVAWGAGLLAILSLNPVAGVALGIIGATIATWMGSDHLGAGGVFQGQPDLVTCDLLSL